MGSSALLLLKLALLAAYYMPAAVPAPSTPAECLKKCGNVDISYPFGTKEDSCFKDPDFQIDCRQDYSNGPYIPYLAREFNDDHEIEVLKISENTSEIYVSMPVSCVCYDPQNNNDTHRWDRFQMPSKFSISNKKNKFFVQGCETYAFLYDHEGKRLHGCDAVCSDDETSNNGTCQSDFELPVANYTINTIFYEYYDEINSSDTRCSYAFVAHIGSFHDSDLNDVEKMRETNRSTVVLDWAVANTNSCGGACKSNHTECVQLESVSGHYFCNCTPPGFLGNPYRVDGCKDVDECLDSNLNKCLHPESCQNTVEATTVLVQVDKKGMA